MMCLDSNLLIQLKADLPWADWLFLIDRSLCSIFFFSEGSSQQGAALEDSSLIVSQNVSGQRLGVAKWSLHVQLLCFLTHYS
jgi:hypothetical protein